MRSLSVTALSLRGMAYARVPGCLGLPQDCLWVFPGPMDTVGLAWARGATPYVPAVDRTFPCLCGGALPLTSPVSVEFAVVFGACASATPGDQPGAWCTCTGKFTFWICPPRALGEVCLQARWPLGATSSRVGAHVLRRSWAGPQSLWTRIVSWTSSRFVWDG